eukprot:1959135-Rhodomonas_salina.2
MPRARSCGKSRGGVRCMSRGVLRCMSRGGLGRMSRGGLDCGCWGGLRVECVSWAARAASLGRAPRTAQSG